LIESTFPHIFDRSLDLMVVGNLLDAFVHVGWHSPGCLCQPKGHEEAVITPPVCKRGGTQPLGAAIAPIRKMHHSLVE
jgi:hypothetical protein